MQGVNDQVWNSTLSDQEEAPTAFSGGFIGGTWEPLSAPPGVSLPRRWVPPSVALWFIQQRNIRFSRASVRVVWISEPQPKQASRLCDDPGKLPRWAITQRHGSRTGRYNGQHLPIARYHEFLFLIIPRTFPSFPHPNIKSRPSGSVALFRFILSTEQVLANPP
jgi:hypothetical protein